MDHIDFPPSGLVTARITVGISVHSKKVAARISGTNADSGLEAPVTLLKAGPNSDGMGASGLALTVDQPYNVISWSGRLLTSSLWTAVVLDVPTLAVLYGPRGLE